MARRMWADELSHGEGEAAREPDQFTTTFGDE
jgi:hypothetical protein